MAAVLTAMDRAEFWLSELKLKGTLRLAPEDAARLAGQETTGLAAALPTAPGWGEMRYLNTFRGTGPFSKRDWLLGVGHRLRQRTIRLCPRPVPPCPRGDPRPAVCQPGGGDRPHDSPKAPQPTGGRRRPIGRPGCAVLWPLAAQTRAARRKIVTGGNRNPGEIDNEKTPHRRLRYDEYMNPKDVPLTATEFSRFARRTC